MSYIYVIGGTDKPYKIGISNDPKRRLKDLQTGHPNKLKIHYKEKVPTDQVRLIEQTIHKTINHRRTHGEWFDLELDQAIAEVKFARIRYVKE